MDEVGVVAPLEGGVLPSVPDLPELSAGWGELGDNSSTGGDFGRGDSSPEVDNVGELMTRGVLQGR